MCIRDSDYSEFIDISEYKDKNPNQYNRQKFTDEEVKTLWEHQDNSICQTVLMLIYSGVRVNELLNLKKENVHLEERYFDVVASKTKSCLLYTSLPRDILAFTVLFNGIARNTH